jgi:nicotinamidase-related amidase
LHHVACALHHTGGGVWISLTQLWNRSGRASHKLIVTGLLAHTCAESTVRFAAELGYDVTMVKDATASFTDEQMHAALRINIPNYANAIVTTEEVLEALSFHLRLTQSASNA